MNRPADIVPSALGLFGWAGSDAPARRVEVLGVPSDAGNGIASGARLGPEAIRAASLSVSRPAIDGLDHGDIAGVHAGDWTRTLQRTQRAVAAIAARGAMPLLLGGDHAVSYAAVAALDRRAPLNLVWFDAHTDFCAWSDGDWHNHKQVLRRISALPHVGRILQIGHRGITYFDESLQSPRMSVIGAGAARTLRARELLDFLPADEAVYLSVDIDAVDPRWAPGTGHPVPGGLEVARLGELAALVATHRELAGLDLMEVNPLLDLDGATALAGATILAATVDALATRPHGSGLAAGRCAA